MQTAQLSRVSIPTPTKWGIHATIGSRPIVWGTFVITSITDSRVTGSVNFRGNPIQIHGLWNENSRKIAFDSPYATYSGDLTIYDDPAIQIRHHVLSGRLMMKPPSQLAGEYGTWIATTDVSMSGSPTNGNKLQPNPDGNLPPVGVFVTSDLLSGQIRR